FAETLKSERKYGYKDQPIIAVTGRKDLDKESYLEAGFAGFLFKPYSPEQLLQTISEALEEDGSFQTKTIEIHQNQNQNKQEHQLFDLRSLASFLEDELAIKNVLEVFTVNTHKDLKSLKKAIDKKDYQTVRDLGNKMQTMFTQINAQTVVPLLHFMEHYKEDQTHQLSENYNALKKNITITLKAMDAHLKN